MRLPLAGARAPARARLLRRLGLGLLIVAALAVGAEGVLRLPPVVAITGGHRPGIRRWEAEHYDRLWEHNPLGLRSFHLDEPKASGARRILALGDDATFGTLVARTEDTWPALLEADLSRDGRHVEIVNAGHGGFTTANEAEWLSIFGARFGADLLILQFSLNDAVPSRPGMHAERSFYYFHLRPLLPVLDPYLSSRSYLYSALDSFKEHQVMRHLHPEGYLPLYADDFEGWKQARGAIREIAGWAAARGIPALLVIFPDLEPDTVLEEGAYRYAPVHAKVRAVAEAAGMDVLDLFPLFAAKGLPPEAWWPIPCEPLAGMEAQRLAADAIRREIEARHLLARQRPRPRPAVAASWATGSFSGRSVSSHATRAVTSGGESCLP